MKNFLRALKYAWPYRKRLFLSIGCALFAAVLWSLNFTAIYPVLKLLWTRQTPQEWVEASLAEAQKEVDTLQVQVDRVGDEEKALDRLPPGDFRDKRHREITAKQARLESKLVSARRSLYFHQVTRKYVHILPVDCFQVLILVIGIVVVAVIVRGLFEFAHESLVGSVVNLSLFDLRNRCYRNVIHLDVGQINEQGTSEVTARFTNDTEVLGAGLKTLFGKLVAEPLKALACIVVACLISWQLTLMFLILVPVALLTLHKVGRMMKRATHRLLERMSSIYKILQETLANLRVVKAFTMEPYERRRFCTATKDYYRKSMRVVNLDALTGPIIEALGVLAIGAALLAGSYLVLRGETRLFGMQMTSGPMEPEALLQLYVMLAAIADPVRKLSSVYTRLQSGAAASDRIFQLMDRQPNVQRNTDCPRLGRPSGSIEFRNVCFSYEPKNEVLTNVNLTVQAGETIALVGPNGCGKTTLVGLLPRFYDPTHGTVFVDGQDIRAVNLRSLRAQVGIVTQDAMLFDDTIFNNIAYGNRRASREEVEEAARKAQAHDFILQCPNGYDTPIGEIPKISGGQKQRIALARAILRDPAILILDEFTSAADPEVDLKIHKALRDYLPGRTTFIITHRLNTLEIADRIVVLDAGRIVAVGTHKELLTSSPLYQRLHDALGQRLCA